MKENKKPKNPKRTYRPTVRYHSIYRTYIDSLFQATELDRNQIMRCALFTAAHNPHFLKLMNEYKTSDVPLPSPLWSHSVHQIWLEQEPIIEEKGGGEEHDNIERKRTYTNNSKVLRTSADSRSMSRTTIQSKQQPSSNQKKEQSIRRQQPIERRTRTLPTVQLSNNGGIRLDLR